MKLIEKYGPWLFWLPVVGYLLLALLSPPIQESPPSIVWVMTLVALLCGMFLLACLYTDPWRRLFSTPLLVQIGRLTYGMYLFHLLALHIAQNLVNTYVSPYFNVNDIYWIWGLYIVLGFGLTWLMAFFSWHLLEKRFYQLRYRFSKIPSGFGA